MKLRSDAVARARLKVYRVNQDGEQEWVGEDDPVQGLLDRVNQDWTRSRMWRAVETYLCLWGQSFRWVNRAESPDPAMWEIWPLRPDKVKVVVGKDGAIAGYIYDIYPRCWRCDRLLGEEFTRPWRKKCLRCQAMNSSPPPEDHSV